MLIGPSPCAVIGGWPRRRGWIVMPTRAPHAALRAATAAVVGWAFPARVGHPSGNMREGVPPCLARESAERSTGSAAPSYTHSWSRRLISLSLVKNAYCRALPRTGATRPEPAQAASELNTIGLFRIEARYTHLPHESNPLGDAASRRRPWSPADRRVVRPPGRDALSRRIQPHFG